MSHFYFILRDISYVSLLDLVPNRNKFLHNLLDRSVGVGSVVLTLFTSVTFAARIFIFFRKPLGVSTKTRKMLLNRS